MPRSDSNRLLSLDVFRGGTIAAMILVNNPGSWQYIYPPLRHAEWHGCTPTDLVFPFFVFIVGVAIVLALQRRVQDGQAPRTLLPKILRRTGLLFGFGLFLHAWPILSFADGIGLHPYLAEIRIPGVLQRLAICYLAGSLLFLFVPRRRYAWVFGGLLAGYWAVMTLVPVPGLDAPNLDGKDTHLAAWLDRTLLDGHLWKHSRTWDPEGILSTFPAVATVMLGLWTGLLLRSDASPADKTARLFARGVLAVIAGVVWGWFFPINKQIWTSSYVLYTGGLAMCGLALCYWWVDVNGHRRGTRPFVVYGVNAITVFVGSGLLARTLNLITIETGGRELTLKAFYYQNLFASWLPPHLASLAHALAWILAWFVVLAWMYRRGIVLRV